MEIIALPNNQGVKAILQYVDIKDVFNQINLSEKIPNLEIVNLGNEMADQVLKRLGYISDSYESIIIIKKFFIINPQTQIKEEFDLYVTSQKLPMNKTQNEIKNGINNNWKNHFTKKPPVMLYQVIYRGNNFFIKDEELMNNPQCSKLIISSLNQLQLEFEKKIENRIKDKNF